MTVREWLAANKWAGDTSKELVRAAVKGTGSSEHQVRKIMRAMKQDVEKTPATAGVTTTAGIPLEEVLKRRDFPARLMNTLKRLCKGKKQVFTDQSIRAASQIPVAVYRPVADRSEFAAWRIKLDGAILWGDPTLCIEALQKQKDMWGV